MKCPNCGCKIKNPIASAGGKAGKRKITATQQAKMQQAKALKKAQLKQN